MQTAYQALYGAHLEEISKRFEKALEQEDYSAVAIHSGTPMYSLFDDYE